MLTERTKPGAFPGDSATDPDRCLWLEWAFSIPPASHIGEVTRYGGADDTPMTMAVCHPGNGKVIVRWDEEQEARKFAGLRAALTRDAGVRAEHITNAKIAGDAYYLLCKLARITGSSDPRVMVQEVIAGYRVDAKPVAWSLDKGFLYKTLDDLRRWPYSKKHINLWLAAMELVRPDEWAPPPPKPPLIVHRAEEWTSITHLGTYHRFGRDHSGTISDRKLAALVVELGGERWDADAWDATNRKRQHRIITVMVRFPPLSDHEEAADV